jgi:D-alanyl-lipoteichoic acid acyltransferase DltB (MBOAT superfamily)
MQFDGAPYLAFLVVVVVAYHTLGTAHRQNVLLVAAGLVFYGWLDWRLCGLLLAYAVTGYAGARWIQARPPGTSARRWAVRVVVGLLLLGLGACKYTPGVLLPIGISFYCFQMVAYVVDVHREMHPPETDPVTFLAFACFFPLLLAGPIERGRNVLPQLRVPRAVGREDVEIALWLLLWGYFQKVVAADSVGGYVDTALAPSAQTTGWVVLAGAVGYALQVYWDFNGYSLIALGSARLLGIRVMWNFDRPYWSTSISEFWRRWHVSLSTWLRDYVFLPLGGASHGAWREYVHLVATMTVAGIWHGAGWAFVAWGAAQGVALVVNRLWTRAPGKPAMPAALGWLLTMTFWTVALLPFRVPSLETLGALLARCDRWHWTPFVSAAAGTMLMVGLPVLLVEAYQGRRRDLLAPARLDAVRFSLVGALLLVAIYARFWGTQHRFIYFQF